MKRAIGKNTAMLVCSAPQFPHGVMDPVEEVSKVRKELLCYSFTPLICKLTFISCPLCAPAGCSLQHPTARGCLFGRVPHRFHGQGRLPPGSLWLQVKRRHQHFCRHPQGKEWLIQVKSASRAWFCCVSLFQPLYLLLLVLQYGYAPKGSSVILYSEKKYRHYQYFVAPDWQGGIYASPSVAGSRPGGIIAACWATMMHMGENGYIDATKKIISTARKIKTE